MASLIDASVRMMHSDMVGSPVLNASTPGSRLAFFDALLVDGWGNQVATSVVVANGICTMTFGTSPPTFTSGVIRVAGATDTTLNGDQRVKTRDGTTVSFLTSAANSSQTSGASAKISPIGFIKPFTSSANTAAYRSPNSSGSGNALCIYDVGAAYIQAQGYEDMSSLAVGTQTFPTNAQVANNGVIWHLASSTYAGPVPWVMVGDDRGFYFMVATYASSGPTYRNYTTYYYTDVKSLRDNDPRPCVISGHNSFTYSAATAFCGLFTRQPNYSWLSRPNTNVGGCCPSMLVSSTNNFAIAAQHSGSDNAGFGNYPNLTDNSLQLGDYMVIENPGNTASTAIRGLMPGILFAAQPLKNSFNHMNIVPAATNGPLVGRTVMAVKVEVAQYASNSVSTPGAAFVDITGPWR